MKNRPYLDLDTLLQTENLNEYSEFKFKDFVKEIKFYENDHEINYMNLTVEDLPEQIELCDLDGNQFLEENGTPVWFDKLTMINIINLKKNFKLERGIHV